MKNVKLIIWDLDDSFWNGTLSDGDVSPNKKMIDIVKKTTDRGIVNSICSKNDFNSTKNKLTTMGVWDYFVFPSIDWSNKGARVKKIIDDMHLRAVDCVFVDDNVNNLEEAKFYAKGITAIKPKELERKIIDILKMGKDDSNHSRLKQYKILEKKNIDKKIASSDEAFLFDSNIRVNLITNCRDKLERIYEMIHRNNQLNFTKNRISQREVNEIFTDNKIVSGVVQVIDKYGDHGIIGCYAVKNGVLLQFVFSCRILGMGVEQWVYSELGYPSINIVGEVASKLSKNDRPKWINQNIDFTSRNGVVNSNISLALYGACPLRPIWAFLQPKIKKAKFAEIDPVPSICNLAVTLRENRYTKQRWFSEILGLDKASTFDSTIVEGEYNYLLVTLVYELSMFKYVDQTNNSHFYLRNSGSFSDPKASKKYKIQKITYDDIFKELSFLCKKISPKTTLLILTIPEVAFNSIGKDNDFYDRKKMNELVYDLSSKYKNVKLVEINDYIKSEADFFDNRPEHYHRSIAFAISKQIASIMNINDNFTYEADNKRTISVATDGVECSYTEKIVNGIYSIEFTGDDLELSEIEFVLYKDRHIESIQNFSDKRYCSFPINKQGYWRFYVAIRNYKNKILRLVSKGFLFAAPTYYKYYDPKDVNSEIYLYSIKYLSLADASDKKCLSTISELIASLSSYGINFSDYLYELGVRDLSLVIDKEIGDLILPFLIRSKIKINKIYTNDFIWNFKIDCGTAFYHVEDINDIPVFKRSDNVLFICNNSKKLVYNSMFLNADFNKFYIDDILSKAKTKYLFSKLFKNRFIAVRVPSLIRNNSFPAKNYTSDEISLTPKVAGINPRFEIDFAIKSKSVTKETANELFRLPSYSLNQKVLVHFLNNIKGKNVNIVNGHRITKNQPINPKIGCIYIVGDLFAFGYGNKDSDTISSQLQKMVGDDYKVENYANCHFPSEYDNVFRLLSHIKLKEKDVIIFIQSNWLKSSAPYSLHWINWDGYASNIEKIDGFTLFLQPNRPNYFLSPHAFTPVFNKKLAELICSALYKKTN